MKGVDKKEEETKSKRKIEERVKDTGKEKLFVKVKNSE